MGYNHPDLLESSPYFDDFSDTKNFLRILFKPGYAVQSRELTQLQTLLQNQVSKFGSHIFKDGSQVFGGGITLSSGNFIRVTITGSGTISDLKNKTIIQGSGNNTVRAKIVDIFSSTTTDPYTILVIQYLTGNTFSTSTSNSISVYEGSTLNINYTSSITGVTTNGTCQFLSVEKGIFYVDGFFVNNDPQTVTLYRLDGGIRKFSDAVLTTEGVTNRVGFVVNRTVVSAANDETLNDPARGFYNYNAPGADRYKINLVLTAEEFDDQLLEPGEQSTADFVELARVVKGVLDYVKKVPTYAELVDTLARRTYDESGNYTVKPFELEVKNHYRNDVYEFGIDFTSNALSNNYVSQIYPGDYLVSVDTPTNRTTKKGLIKSVTAYIPSSTEVGTAGVPDYVLTVTREPIEITGGELTYNYPFFTSSDVIAHRPVNNSGDVNFGNITRISVSRDPNGVYSPEEGGVDSKYVLSIKPGKAYVFGYEFETINNTNIIVDKQINDSFVSLNNYNLGSNVGNYFVVKANQNTTNGAYSFNNWSSSINLEEMPYMKFGGNYIRITIPYQAEQKAEQYCKYWSNCAPDQIENDARSVLFVTTETGLTRESNANDVTDFKLLDPTGVEGEQGYIRPLDAEYDRTKYIGGMTSGLSHKIVNMSESVEVNISRLVFTDPWHGNFQTAYNLNSETDDTASVYGEENFPVKQIKCVSTSDPTSIKVVTGNALRWIPASSTGATTTAGSTLFVYVDEAATSEGGRDPTGTAHFNVEDGVVFSDPLTTTSPISYGSSISYVVRENNVKKVIITSSSNIDCNSTPDCASQDGRGGFYSVGDICSQTYTKSGQNVYVEGEIVAIGGNFGPKEIVELYIQVSGTDEIYGSNDSEVGDTVTNLGCLVGPCGVYIPTTTQSLSSEPCGELVRIGFLDSENVGAFEPNQTAFQYNYLSLGEDDEGNPRYLEADLVKGTIISWNFQRRELVVLETQGRFEIANGTVYQLDSGTGTSVVKYGGRGWDKSRTKYQKQTTSVSFGDIELASGIFIDISEQVTSNFRETSYSVFESIGSQGELIRQIAIPLVENTVDSTLLIPNESIYQIINQTNNQIARGIVISFKGRDLGDIANIDDVVLVIQPTNNVNFQVGNASVSKITSSRDPSIQFDVSPSGTIKTKEIIGCGRFRLLKKQSDDSYQAYFFDVKMDYVPDNTRKYNLNEVFYFFYEEAFKNASIYGFESDTEDIQLDGLTDTQYVFEVHPTKGIDNNLSTTQIKYSRIYDTNRNTLIFKLPGSSSVKTVGEMDYRIQKQFSGITGVDTNTITVSSAQSANVRFIGGESDNTGRVDASDLMSHYTLIVNGVIVDLTDGYTVTTNNFSAPNSVATVTVQKTSGNFESNVFYQLICNLNVNDTAIRTKTEKRYTETITLRKTKVGTYKALLSKSDVIGIDRITISSGSLNDIQHQFEFFNGQTDNVYDVGQLTLKNEYLVNGAPLSTSYTVTYRYFEHIGNGPITIDSYPVSYTNIPYYTSPASGLTYKLDSVIDLRPVKSAGAILPQTKWIPSPATSFDVDFDYYLARSYKLVITRDLKFKLISGTPAVDPQLPQDDQNAMTIYNIVTEPYVFDKSDVLATMVNNRRYTMKDIITLDERIQALEKFTSLNSLEQKAQLDPMLDDNNTPRVVSAILVDNFNSHSRADTLNAQYNVSIDPESNVIRAPFRLHSAQLEVDATSLTQSGCVKTTDNILLNDYSTSSFISQLTYNTVEKINQFNDIAWIGTVSLSPSTDSWFDEEEKPDIRINEYGVNDTFITVNPSSDNNDNYGFGMEWGIWQSKWHGKKKEVTNKNTIPSNIVSSNRKIIKGITQDEKVTPTALNSINTFNVGENTIVDKSVVPYIREKTITGVAQGLKPFATVYVFFDDVDITADCEIYSGVGQSISDGSLKTSSNGSLQFTYNIQKGKFKAGEILLTITDSATNDSTSCTTIAEAIYTVSGVLETANNTYVSSAKAIKKPSNYSKNISDPLAQTFFVDEQKYPEGIFVESVDVFFASKDTVLPVTLEIRPTNNSYPASREETIIYPYASVTVDASSVVTSEDPSASIDKSKTTFTFTTPVHLLPGEHSIVLRSNSSEYSIYVGELGVELETTATRIAQQSAVGSFFKTQNAGKWDKYENIDMMFNINKCDFTTSVYPVKLKDVVSSTIGVKDYHSYMLSTDDVKFNNTALTYKIATTSYSQSGLPSGTTGIDVTPDVVNYSGITNRIAYTGNTIAVFANLSTSNSDVSPVVDLNRLNLVLIENLIENNTNIIKDSIEYNGELDPRTPINLNSTARARYISKIVELEPGFESTNVKVVFGANVPAGTSIQVFLKQQNSGSDGSFDEENYLQLAPTNPDYVSPDTETFNDLMFTLPSDLTQPFSKFAIKICLYSSNAAVTPKIKEMRVISVI